ncbi:uncharacterized protein K02A2.6-like [Zophobas morio]|uniref:uncharacterized protein K02A2.6-like n=1 Tax=Zophobas morio TaxID=2755281 RepID=UPI00308300D5
MAQEMGMFRRPPELDFSTNVSFKWDLWKQQFELFLMAISKEDETEKRKIAIFLNVVGEEGVKIYNSYKLGEQADLTLAIVLNKFGDHCKPRRNVIYKRYCFLKIRQKEGQSFDAYVTELKNAAMKCEYGDQQDSIIRDQIIFNVRETRLQEQLINEKDITLEKTLEKCRSAEISKFQINEFSKGNQHPMANVSAINKKKQPMKQMKTGKPTTKIINNCRNCGQVSHPVNKCPAFNQTCRKCKKPNHFAKVCRSKTNSNYSVHEIEDEEVNMSSLQVLNLKIEGITAEENTWYEEVEIQGQKLNCKIDTGAQVSVLPYNDFKSLNTKKKLQPTNVTLVAYGNKNFKITPVGQVTLKLKVGNQIAEVNFVVVNPSSGAILGLQDCLKLQLISRSTKVNEPQKYIHELTMEMVTEKYKSIFNGIGKIPGTHHITVSSEVKPVINPPRLVPLSLHTRLKTTLEKFSKEGIVSKVSKPTKWVNNLVIIEKPNGELRLCLDPKDLNTAIQREIYQIQTPETIIAQLSNKEYFSVFDMCQGFWQIVLDEESSELCTFNTPFGRYKFNRLPFGLKSSPEVFQKKNEEMFGDIPGVHVYFDDIIISGEDERAHDRNLQLFLNRAAQNNVKLNSTKVQFKVKTIRYCGHIISKNSVAMDSKFTKAITELQIPKDKKHLLKFLGMLKYLSKFIPNMSQISAPLRELTKENTPFQWDEIHTESFNKLKAIIAKPPTLGIFTSNQQLKIQTDASKDGVGAVLLSNNQPIAFASAALSSNKQNWAQIEKEMYAIEFACKKFHYYTYGRHVIVNSDHKPLESIFKKGINQISARLQRMRLQLLKYEITVEYLQGSQMFVADYLSRSFLNEIEPDSVDFTVHTLQKEIVISDEKQNQIKEETKNDQDLKQILHFYEHGWPNNVKQYSKVVKHFWKIKHDITVNNGIIYFNERIVVPQSFQSYMLKILHETHLGIEKTKARAREVLYWLGMCKDIYEYISGCEMCEKFNRNPQKEPLRSYECPTRPWFRISADIAYYAGNEYLVVIDSYSKWIELKKLKYKDSYELIKHFKEIFSRQEISRISGILKSLLLAQIIRNLTD